VEKAHELEGLKMKITCTIKKDYPGAGMRAYYYLDILNVGWIRISKRQAIKLGILEKNKVSK
jgi:hypothetical protein